MREFFHRGAIEPRRSCRLANKVHGAYQWAAEKAIDTLLMLGARKVEILLMPAGRDDDAGRLGKLEWNTYTPMTDSFFGGWLLIFAVGDRRSKD